MQALGATLIDSAGALRARIACERPRGWSLVCVVDLDDHLLGTLIAAELLALPDDAHLGRHARHDAPRVLPGTDQQKMGSLALPHGVSAMPVTDAAGRLIGVVGPNPLIDIPREHAEDLHRLDGIKRETRQARRAIEAPPLRRGCPRCQLCGWQFRGLTGSRGSGA